MPGFFRPVVAFLFHINYFGPLLLGIADSSFLILPFGNDLLVVGLISRHHHGIPFYIFAAAAGSTIGVFILDLVARRLGEEGIRKIAGDKKFEKLKNKIGKRSGVAVLIASLAPPPFPFTMVIGTASALKYSRPRLLGFTALARLVRFCIVAVLAAEFGQQVTKVAKSPAFEYSMGAFVALCVILTGFSAWKWLRRK